MYTHAQPDLIDLKWAYHVLEAEHTASAVVLKKHYRDMVKKWHPDKFALDPAQQAKATQKTQEINQAYQKIKDAPLRYHISSHPRAQQRAEKKAQAATAAHKPKKAARYSSLHEYARMRRRGEFWSRFIFGVLLSGIPTAYVAVDLGIEGRDLAILAICMALFCGFASTRYRDHFWSGVLDDPRWW